MFDRTLIHFQIAELIVITFNSNLYRNSICTQPMNFQRSRKLWKPALPMRDKTAHHTSLPNSIFMPIKTLETEHLEFPPMKHRACKADDFLICVTKEKKILEKSVTVFKQQITFSINIPNQFN